MEKRSGVCGSLTLISSDSVLAESRDRRFTSLASFRSEVRPNFCLKIMSVSLSIKGCTLAAAKPLSAMVVIETRAIVGFYGGW